MQLRVKALAAGDGESFVSSPAARSAAVVDRDEVGTQAVEDVVVWGWPATGFVGLEAADEPSAVGQGQPVAGRYGVVKEQCRQVLGSEHSVFV
jgi:hypothetical protein